MVGADTAALHRRLMAGDPTAPADLFAAYYEDVVAWLRRQGLSLPRGVDPDVYYEAAFRALTSYAQRPSAYDPARRGLRGYLRMAARGDLLNLLERERRRARLLAPLDVADAAAARNRERGGPEEASEAEALVARVREERPEAERRVLDLMAQGERRIAPYVEALGLAHLPGDEQRRRVKQAKDRLKKRLRRRRAAHGA
mgnify:CR=1 FL=1